MDIKIKNDNNIKFKYRVAAIIINDNMLLVDKYGKDSYCLPGGYVEIGETSEEAMLRELVEEINIDFEIVKFRGILENFFINIRKDKTHGIEFYYEVKAKKKSDYYKIDLTNIENDKGYIVKHNFKWISLNCLENINIVPNKIVPMIIDGVPFFHEILKEYK